MKRAVVMSPPRWAQRLPDSVARILMDCRYCQPGIGYFILAEQWLMVTLQNKPFFGFLSRIGIKQTRLSWSMFFAMI